MFRFVKYSLAERRQRSYRRKKTISERVGKKSGLIVILDSEDVLVVRKFVKFKEELGIADNRFLLMVCTNGSWRDSENLKFFSTDIDFIGRIKKEEVQKVFGMQFEVMVAYIQPKHPHLNFAIRNIQAGLKVGREDNQEDQFDLSISSRFGDIDEFLREVKRYLKVIKKVE